jgi:hypothetical protein
MQSLTVLQLDNVSSYRFVYHERMDFIRRNEFQRKRRSEKSEEEINFGCGALMPWSKRNWLWQDAKFSDKPNLNHEA